ncbi:hypothetical protein BD309DRAFT_1016047 [Dichomitus squalens]|uniref:Uncharacterized protein n=1 Tax=Dichomitus squalens TaxID=114155 RepID=A0A4Q9P4Z2_9APHY|nr:hypothetical protein BD309DRAFT_1016047 [Dichomitus squalens]TBU56449.1 hypothetical protein BD310DRAFT_823643 [Dichomitus squalens]
MKHLVVRRATPDARNLVLQLIREHQSGLTIQELYKQSMDYQQKNLTNTVEDADQDYVIPSMRYLKKVVLPELADAGQVEKVHLKRTLSAEEADKLHIGLVKSKKSTLLAGQPQWLWLWQLKAKEPEQPPKPEKKPFGAEVGVGEDFSHLNKRRQRARVEKVERDVQWMRELEKVKKEARVRAS